MKKIKFFLYPLIFIFVSCSSLKIKDRISIDENFDWLQRGKSISNSNYGIGNTSKELKQLWSFNADAGFSKNALIATDGILFASTLRGETFGINILNGKSLGRFGKTGGAVNCPVFSNSNLVLTFDGNEDASVLRYDLKTGGLIWKLNYGMIKSAPVIENDYIYLTSKDSSVYKIRLSDGGVVWKTNKDKDGKRIDQIKSTAIIIKDNVYTITVKGNLLCINKLTGEVVWSKNLSSNILSDISSNDDNIYISTEDGRIFCYSFIGDIIWEKKFKTSFTSSFAFIEDNLFIGGISGELFKLNSQTGEILWEFKTNGALYSNPVVFDNKIFQGSTDKNLYMLDVNSGEKLWSMKFESRIRTSPLVWRNYLFVACDNREIYCFEFKK